MFNFLLTWDIFAPLCCSVMRCDKHRPGVNADALFGYKEPLEFGQSVQYVCWEGYEREGGMASITCNGSKEWTGDALRCKRKRRLKSVNFCPTYLHFAVVYVLVRVKGRGEREGREGRGGNGIRKERRREGIGGRGPRGGGLLEQF